MTSSDISAEDVNRHYKMRHDKVRAAIYSGKPYANYGYWARTGMPVDEACEALFDVVARELELKAGDQLLECGCGYGAGAMYLMQKYKPAKILGLDVTDVRIEQGRKAVQEKGFGDRIEIRYGDATKLDLPDASFDKVLAVECAFHFNTRWDFFREAFRVLKPGGIVALTDVVLDPGIDPSTQTPEAINKYLLLKARMYCAANICNPQDYQRRVEKAGFKPVKIYSIKAHTALQFADHLERSAAKVDDAEVRDRILAYAKHFRTDFMKGGDYVVVRAVKPAA